MEKRQYRAVIQSTDYYFVDVMATNEAEAMQLASEADGFEWEFIDYGDWEIESIMELEPEERKANE